MPALRAYLFVPFSVLFVFLFCHSFGQQQIPVYHISKKYDVSNLFGTWRCAVPERHNDDSTLFDYTFHKDMTCDLRLISNKNTLAVPTHYIFFMQTDTIVLRSIESGNISRVQILKLEKNFLRWVVLLDEGGRGAIMDFRRMSF